MKNHKMWYRVDPPTVNMEDYIWSIDGKYKIYDTETGEWKELSQEDPAKKAIYTFIIYLSVTKGLVPESPEFSKHCKVVVVNGEAKLLDQYYFNSKEWYSISSGLSDGTTAYWTVDNRLHTEDNNEDVYYSIIMIDGFGNILNASTPENLKGTKGEQGKPGIDGSVIEYLYKRFKTLDEAELAIPPVSKDDDGWTEEPKGVNATFRVEVVSDRKRDIESGEWSDWSDPVVWATYSDDGLDGTTYKEFKVYTLVPGYLDVPKTPTGGTWASGNERLLQLPVDPDGIYEWTDIAPQANEKYAWYSTAVFRNSDGAKDSNWTPPMRYGAIPVEVDEYYRYYQAFNKETLDPEDIPSLNEDPTEKGWSLENNTRLSEDLKYVWSFERIIYSTEQSFQTEPVIIRQYIAEVEADYSRVKEVAEDAITEQLEDTTTRLGQINETNTLIEEDKGTGLIKLLTQYKDGDKTSFADIIANAADATIKQSVGSAIGHDITGVSATLDGINGLLRNHVTKLSGINGTVASAMQQIKADAITQSVSQGTYYWQRQIHDPASEIIDPTSEGYWVDDTENRSELPVTIPEEDDWSAPGVAYRIKNVTDEGIVDNTPDPISGVITVESGNIPYQWVKTTTISKMSAINQTSDKIELMIGDANSTLASITMEAPDGSGEIWLNSDKIHLNGEVIANAISANSITIGKKDPETGDWKGGYAVLSEKGLLASGATIIGNINAGQGFFGIYEETEQLDDKGNVIDRTFTPIDGVNIGTYGSDGSLKGGIWSNDYNGHDKGFFLGSNHFEFYGNDNGKTYIKDSGLCLAQGTIGGITITSTELIGKNTVEYLIISYNGRDYAVIKDGIRQMTATCDLINAVANRDWTPSSTGLINWIKANITHSNNINITKEQWIDWSNNSSYGTTYSERTENKVDFGFSTDHTSGNSICAWFGGIKEDRASSSDNPIDAAKILFRYDGSGYLASNKLKWDTNGALIIDSGATIGPFELDDDGFNYVTEYFKDRSPDTDELVHTEISLNTDKLRVYKWRAPQQTYDPDATKSIWEEVVISSNKISGQGRYNYTNFDGVSVRENHNFTIENNGDIYGAQFTLPASNTVTPIGSNVITVGDPELRYGGLTFYESDVEIYINPTIYTPGKIFWILPTATVSKFYLKCAYPVYSWYGGRGHVISANESDPWNIPAPIMVIFGSNRLIYTIKMGGTT